MMIDNEMKINVLDAKKKNQKYCLQKKINENQNEHSTIKIRKS